MIFMDDQSHTSVIEAAGGILWRERENKREIAVIHRIDHDDWSLPKGKKHPGEIWENTALREVLEETGYQAKIDGFAGTLTYTINGQPKVVLYWHMTPLAKTDKFMNGEVDRVMWLSREEALEKLDYEDEKQLLLSQFEAPIKGS